MKPDRLVLFVTLCLVGGVLVGTTSSASSRDQDRSDADVLSFPQNHRSEAFWRQAIETARPMIPRVGARGPRETASARTGPTQDAAGRPAVIPPTGPQGTSDGSLPEYVSYGGSARDAGGLYPAIPFTSSEISEPKKAPFHRHGKLFFTNGGKTYQCSGTVVTAANESVVATAGHCVFDDETDTPNSSTMFIPGYDDGDMPYGIWDATRVLTTDQWMNGSRGDLRYDVGMVIVEQQEGRTIQDTLGSRGIAFRQNPAQSFDAYGYPADEPFDGGDLFHCASGPGYVDPFFPNPAPNAIGCDLTAGASGGAWTIQTAEGEVVNSVNSYLYPAVPGVVFGPYFGNIAEALYNVAAGDPGGRPTPGATPSQIGNGPVRHELDLSFKLEGHLRAKGSLTSLDGYVKCTQGAPVGIYKLIDATHGRLVASAHNTGPSSRFGYWIPDKRGKYFANVFARRINAKHRCARVQSDVVRHRH
jgi:hypothetical protein